MFILSYCAMSKNELEATYVQLQAAFAECKAKNLKLDMSRGKPGRQQLDLVSDMLTTLQTPVDCVADGLDVSHRQKFSDFQIRNQDGKMVITVETEEDISLEKGLFDQSAEFFEEVFGLCPVIKQKKK